ncbi:hypothetical protein HOLleu_19955 [Holothuria leucospilota]|uniref:Uncharacterized protein n=1 Tax=Holothuria leucospilota TaxID=206669 RepID=A0A9Q1H824_HOLLE|nr:hypothetical protein HOLleu_19955 [Holothuria leucospilota]
MLHCSNGLCDGDCGCNGDNNTNGGGGDDGTSNDDDDGTGGNSEDGDGDGDGNGDGGGGGDDDAASDDDVGSACRWERLEKRNGENKYIDNYRNYPQDDEKWAMLLLRDEMVSWNASQGGKKGKSGWKQYGSHSYEVDLQESNFYGQDSHKTKTES